MANYWIRALPNSGHRDLAAGFNGGTNSAILRYKGAPKADPITQQKPHPKVLEETDLHPLTDPRAPGKPFPGGADVNINLNFGFDIDAFRFSVNGASFTTPTVPVLLQILSGAQYAQDLLPKGSVYTLPKNKVIEITMPAGVVGGPVSSFFRIDCR